MSIPSRCDPGRRRFLRGGAAALGLGLAAGLGLDRARAEGLRPVVVCIDPGHGGHDPGCIGAKGLREKDVVLDVALRVGALLEAVPGLQVVYSRRTDVFVPLAQRLQLGIRQRADLFLSIHADAFPERDVRGSSVWILSERGASSSAARWLAQSQNGDFWDSSAALAGSRELHDVLLDLSRSAASSAATRAAQLLLRALAEVEDLHAAQVQKANFVVLRAPNVPSLLVETAFLSNPEEEKRLRDPDFRALLAQSISDAVLAHFVQAPPSDSRWSSARHAIAPGETLSELSARYGVRPNVLRLANGLVSAQLPAWGYLRVPILHA